ncbi:unnamed protein product, partial [Vitis vinifera]|uniref:Uncharacterized protein n=1 Tax=Vitis vinifera TaxID=29760 RepID=D7U604_VITVI
MAIKVNHLLFYGLLALYIILISKTVGFTGLYMQKLQTRSPLVERRRAQSPPPPPNSPGSHNP